MRLPGFNAESALGPARYHYRGRAIHGAGAEPLAPQQYLDEDELDTEEELEEELDDEIDENGEMLEEG
jgi:hypothetical protein